MDNLQIPEAFTSGIGMGVVRGYHPFKNGYRWASLVTCLVLLVGAIVVFLYGIYVTYLAYQLHGPAMIDDKLIGPSVVAFIMFGFGLLAGWGAYANWKKGVAVYERGFVYNDRKGLQTWHWEDILSLTSAITRHYHNGIYTGTTHVYTLLNHQNQKLVLTDSFTRIEEIAAVVEMNIFLLLYPRAADQYNAGQMLGFGPVVISKQGLVIGKKTYPWTDVKQVSIHQGRLKVSKKDGGLFSGASAAVSTIPNLHVLLAIIREVVGLKAG